MYVSYDLHIELFPELNEDLVKIFILEIYSRNPLVCNIEEPYPFANPIISSNGATRSFLDSGGFTEIERKNNIELEKERIRQEKQDKSLDLDLVLKQFTIELSKYEKKVSHKIVLGGFIIGILSFLISALTSGLFSSDDKKPQQNNQEVTQEQIQLLSKQKDSLIFSLERKIDSLHKN